MPAAVVAAGVGAAASIGGAALSAKAQKKAANKAAQTATDTTAANNQLAREQYGQNAAVLAPYIQRGNQAGALYGGLLGLGSGGGVLAPAANNNMGAAYVGPGQQLTYAPGNSAFNSGGYYNGEPVSDLTYSAMPYSYNPTDTGVGTYTQPTAADDNASYEDAFAKFQNSTGYQFRLNQGIRALDASASSRGVLQSGAAQKGVLSYGQGLASDEFGNFMGYLGNLMGGGLSAAGAQAGVSTNMVNQVTANNNSAASAAANAALAKGNANGQLWSSIGSGIGNVVGVLSPSLKLANKN